MSISHRSSTPGSTISAATAQSDTSRGSHRCSRSSRRAWRDFAKSIHIVREPLGWYASVKKRAAEDGKPKRSAKKRLYAGFEQVEAAYLDNIRSIHANRTLFGNRYVLVDYGDLVADTETTARALAACLGLDWHPSLTRQTFNGMPIQPNTSFQGEGLGNRGSILTAEDVDRISDGPMMAAYRTTCS